MVTGSLDYFGPTPPKKKKDDGVQEFFENMGYEVLWDFKNYGGIGREEWWEIYEDDDLVAQIDMHVPLKYVIEDIAYFYMEKPCIDRPDKPDWKFSGEGEKTNKLLKKVYDHWIANGNSL